MQSSVPGFWPIANHCHSYSKTQKPLSNSSFIGGLPIPIGFGTQVYLIGVQYPPANEKRSFQEQNMNIAMGQHVFPSFRSQIFPFLGTQILKGYSYCHVLLMLNTVGCWQAAQTPTCFRISLGLRHLYMLYIGVSIDFGDSRSSIFIGLSLINTCKPSM